MGRQYYCDYCLRSFRDTSQSRKRHLKSGEHLRAKQNYFNDFKSSFQLLTEEYNKSVCNHFYRNNFCKFGDNCLYSHLTYDRLQELKQKAFFEEFCKASGQTSGPNSGLIDSNFESKSHSNVWLKNRFKIIETNDQINVNSTHNSFQLKQLFSTLSPQQIPLSLIPPSIQEFNDSEECLWN